MSRWLAIRVLHCSPLSSRERQVTTPNSSNNSCTSRASVWLPKEKEVCSNNARRNTALYAGVPAQTCSGTPPSHAGWADRVPCTSRATSSRSRSSRSPNSVSQPTSLDPPRNIATRSPGWSSSSSFHSSIGTPSTSTRHRTGWLCVPVSWNPSRVRTRNVGWDPEWKNVVARTGSPERSSSLTSTSSVSLCGATPGTRLPICTVVPSDLRR